MSSRQLIQYDSVCKVDVPAWQMSSASKHIMILDRANEVVDVILDMESVIMTMSAFPFYLPSTFLL